MNDLLSNLSKRERLITLACITILGAGLRLFRIDFQSLWFDELHCIIPTAPQNSILSIIEYSKSDQPPFFFIYLHFFFKIFGYNETVGRIASAVIGILSIPAMYLLGKEFRGYQTGIFAAFLAALNYFLIDYSQELRFYSMVFLLTTLSYLFFIRAYKHSRLIDFGIYILCTTALVYTHYFGMVVYATQAFTFVLLAFFFKRESKFIIAGVLSGIIIGLAFLPWVPVVITDLGTPSFWIQKPKPSFILDYFYSYFGKDVFITLFFVIFIVMFVRSALRTKDKKEKAIYLILIIWLLFSYLIPYVKSLVSVPMLHIRYTIIALPAWLMIFAIGWDTIQYMRWKYALIVLITISSVVNLIFFRKHYSKIKKQQFREVSELVKLKNTDHSPIVTSFPWHFNFYFRDDENKAIDLNSLDQVSADKFWLMQVDFFTPEEKARELERFTDEYEIVEKYPFFKTDALLLKRKK